MSKELKVHTYFLQGLCGGNIKIGKTSQEPMQLYWAIVFDIANCDIKGPLPEQLHRQLGRKYNETL